MHASSSSGSSRRLIRAAAAVDALGMRAAPAAVLIEGKRVVAAGSPEMIGDVADAKVINRPDALLLPGLANVHAHLDLTMLGPRPYAADFLAWVDMVRRSRPTEPGAIRAAVERGAQLARMGGTALIGDIAGAGRTEAVAALRDSGAGLRGVSSLEVFGIGAKEEDAVGHVVDVAARVAHDVSGIKLGLQPHAPYSCGKRVYEKAARLGLPLATHLAETQAELEFTRSATGPFADLLRKFGLWGEGIQALGMHPLDALSAALARTPWVIAHLNYVEDAHLDLLAQWDVTVAYCPRASAYFGHAGHRYREMLEHGVRVALGTDSIVCLDRADRISVLDEMRFLWRRDGMEAMTLLRMATVGGAEGLGFDGGMCSLQAGAEAGVLALPIDLGSDREPLVQALERDDAPEWV